MNAQIDRYDWSRLTSLQLGRYAEYFVKMEFTLFGFDVYGAEVDDRGIDFVARSDSGIYWDVQVKSARPTKTGKGYNYQYMRKEKFSLRENLLLALVLFPRFKQPLLYLIPANVWRETNNFFVSRNYEGKKSAPEWGLELSVAKNLKYLEPFGFSDILDRIADVAKPSAK